MSAVGGEKYVKEQVEQHPVVVFGRARCPACVSAKSHLDQQSKGVLSAEDIKYIYLESLGSSQYAVSSFLQRSTGRNASPFVYIGGTFVGNNVDVRNLIVNGGLRPAMSDAKRAVTDQLVSA